ncbi:MAG: hypothetical protein M3416_21475, partial [Acidobacteriota bacterium]|nr:hypothetical protein [Acidobacteriota bacterium]
APRGALIVPCPPSLAAGLPTFSRNKKRRLGWKPSAAGGCSEVRNGYWHFTIPARPAECFCDEATKNGDGPHAAGYGRLNPAAIRGFGTRTVPGFELRKQVVFNSKPGTRNYVIVDLCSPRLYACKMFVN